MDIWPNQFMPTLLVLDTVSLVSEREYVWLFYIDINRYCYWLKPVTDISHDTKQALNRGKKLSWTK